MQINSSDNERTASSLLSGCTTFVLNTIGNLEAILKDCQEQIKQRDERIKTLESEIQTLENNLNDK